MKKLMLGLMMAFAVTAEAVILKEYTLSDTLTATLDDQGMLTISGSGPMPDWVAAADQVWSQERLQIRSVVGEGVTSVGMYAFFGCGNLTSVSFPNATTVGAHAFRTCSNLTSVSFPNATTVGKSAFMNCRWLTSVSFPNPNATTVGMSAFGNCLELTSVTIPNATTIGEGAFSGCNSIETVVLSLDLAANPDRTGWGLRDQAKLLGLGTKEDVENAKVEDVVWTIGEAQVKNKDYERGCAYHGVTPKSVQIVPPPPAPPAGAVTSWDALTNAVATAASGATVAVGADITEDGGELVVPAGKAVTIKLYGKTVTCAQVTVNGALSVGDADDSVGRIVATGGAKLAKSGSVAILGGPMRGTFTVLTSGVTLLFK